MNNEEFSIYIAFPLAKKFTSIKIKYPWNMQILHEKQTNEGTLFILSTLDFWRLHSDKSSVYYTI